MKTITAIALALGIAATCVLPASGADHGEYEPINLNNIEDNKEAVYCTVRQKNRVCFVFKKNKESVYGILHFPYNYEDFTCFYGSISKKRPYILNGSGYEFVPIGITKPRGYFQPSIKSEYVVLNYEKLELDNTKTRVKFVNAIINFDSFDEVMFFVSEDSRLYKNLYLETNTPQIDNCSKLRF